MKRLYRTPGKEMLQISPAEMSEMEAITQLNRDQPDFSDDIYVCNYMFYAAYTTNVNPNTYPDGVKTEYGKCLPILQNPRSWWTLTTPSPSA